MYLAIDLGSQYIHIVEGIWTSRGIKVKDSIEIEMPMGSFDEMGRVRYEEIGKRIKEVFKKKQVKAKDVMLSLQSEQMISREFTIPKVKTKDIQAILKQELTLLLESDREYVMVYEQPILEESMMKVLVSALPLELVEDCFKLVKYIGCHLKAFNTHEIYMRKRMEVLRRQENFLIVDIGSQRMQLYLYEKGKSIFTQNVEINTRQHEMTFASLNEMQGIQQEFKDVQLLGQQFNVHPILEETIRSYLTDLSSQIHYMTQFQLNRNAKEPIQAIYVYGGVSYMAGLCEYLENELGIKVRIITDLISQDKDEIWNRLSFVNALNALELSRGNLYDFVKAYKSLKKEEHKVSSITVVGSFALAFQLIAIMVFGILNMQKVLVLNQKANQLHALLQDEAINQQLEELERVRDDNLKKQTQLKLLQAADNQIKAFPIIDKAFFERLTKKLPKDMVINALSYEQGELYLDSQCSQEESIISYVQYLRDLPDIEQVVYQGFSQVDGHYTFKLTICLKGGVCLETES